VIHVDDGSRKVVEDLATAGVGSMNAGYGPETRSPQVGEQRVDRWSPGTGRPSNSVADANGAAHVPTLKRLTVEQAFRQGVEERSVAIQPLDVPKILWAEPAESIVLGRGRLAAVRGQSRYGDPEEKSVAHPCRLVENVGDPDFAAQLFLDLAYRGLLERLARFDLAAR
jgi:hypothetical protein